MPRLLSVLVVLALVLVINLAAMAQDNEADAIIAKAIKAQLGSGKGMKKLGYRGKNKGILHRNGMEIEFTQEVAVQVPKFKEVVSTSIDGKDIKVITVYNGKQAWMRVNDVNVDVNKDLLEEFKEAAALMSITQGVFVKDKTLKLSVIGEVMVNGKPSVGIRIVREGKKAGVEMYFDKATGLTSKVERRKRDLMSGQEVSEERIILEYQELEGRKHPKKIEVKIDGKKSVDVEVLEGQFFDKIDEAEFGKP